MSFRERFAFLTRQRVLGLILVLGLSFVVRGLTANFIGERLDDPGWFQSGSYAIFDARAKDILDGKSAILIEHPSRTDAAVYPPGYPLWVALIYGLTGEQTAAAVQRVQWPLDALAVLLVVGIGVSAFGWRPGFLAGVLAALSPLLALSGATPTADAPASWAVLGSVWALIISVQRRSWGWALLAGLLIGLSCWFRVNALLLIIWWIPFILLVPSLTIRNKTQLCSAVLLGGVLLLAPVTIRNWLTFGMFMPTGLGVGTNLWEGLGETDRAEEFGAVYGDAHLIEQERINLNIRPGDEFGLYYPDGVVRDRERMQKALAVIAADPVWYAGVMARRMWGVLNVTGEPGKYYGSPGINCTPAKCLPPAWRDGGVAPAVMALAMAQSVSRFLFLPLMLVGLCVAIRTNLAMFLLLFSTALYYLVPGTFAHVELRYVLPMHAIMWVFAGHGLSSAAELTLRFTKRLR